MDPLDQPARALEGGLDDEIRFHLDQQTEKLRRAGLSPDEARRQALLKFGGVEGIRERTRDEFRPALLEDSSATSATASACCGGRPASPPRPS